MKYIIALAFLAILGSLASALFFILRGNRRAADDPRKSSPIVRALALRVGLSIVLFVCILLAWKFGYIHPTGLPMSR